MYKRFLGVLFIIFITVFCGCDAFDELDSDSETESSSSDSEDSETVFTVGVTNLSDDDFFASLRIENLESLADSFEVEMIVEDAQFDSDLQLEQIDEFIERGVSAVVISPVDYDTISTGVVKLNEADIPVITLGIETDEGESCYIGSPNVEAGRMQAEYIADTLSNGAKVLYLEGESDLYHSKERKEGFLEIINTTRSDITILDSSDAQYDEETAEKIMAKWIEEYDDFDAVVAANDMMALGAITVLKENDLLDEVIVIGIDGSNERALEAIENGELTMTVYQNAEEQAVQCMNVLESLKEGEELPEDINVPFEEITIDNVDEYINSDDE